MKEKLKIAAGIAGLFLAPFVSYVLFEYVTGNLTAIPRDMALLNIYWIALFYILIFALSGNSRITMGVSSAVILFIALAETFVYSFRGRPIMLSEVLALKTALSVAGSYSFTFTKQMIQAAAAVLIMNAGFWFFPITVKGVKFRILNLAACAAAVYLGVQNFYGTILPERKLVVNLWSVNDTYNTCGFLLSSAVSVQYMTSEEPEGYSNARLEKIYQESVERLEERADRISEEAIQPVNLICIMNESLAEMKVNGSYETNIPYFSFLDQLKENTVYGSLCVPVYGSLTSNTEYEFLTGDSMALLPVHSIAYQFFVLPESMSMVSTLKEQGYRTVAMHPYPGENWNRINCYENFGFDEFLDEEYYADSEQLRLYVSDKADYDKIIGLVEEKEHPDDKLFVFNVTMQNHGGYESIYENFQQEVWLTGDLEGKYPKADQFLSLMKKSDDAFRYLIEYFEGIEEPTMIVMFGDHQPGVESEFFEDVSGVKNSEMPHEEQLMWYETPFLIWTNYEQESEDMGRLSSVFLASHVLDRANVTITPYDAFLLELSQTLPVVHVLGCYTDDGSFYSWTDAENGGHSFSELLMEYEMLVYNHSIDRNEMEKLYQLQMK